MKSIVCVGYFAYYTSLPSRECGLKYVKQIYIMFHVKVTPFAGVWIEIRLNVSDWVHQTVTPFAGVWIEMVSPLLLADIGIVTPFAGVWIEIQKSAG